MEFTELSLCLSGVLFNVDPGIEGESAGVWIGLDNFLNWLTFFALSLSLSLSLSRFSLIYLVGAICAHDFGGFGGSSGKRGHFRRIRRGMCVRA